MLVCCIWIRRGGIWSGCRAAKGRHMTRARNRAREPRAFSIIELLIVIAIIALLMSMLLPSLHKARESARSLTCQMHLRQIGMSIRSYLMEQGDDEIFLDLYPRHPNIADRWNAMLLLDPYMHGPADGGLFDCPSAIGRSSVRDPETRLLMEYGSAQVHVRDYDGDQKEEFTEYWFNDSRSTTYGELFGPDARNPDKPLGVSGQDLTRLENAESIIWAADAVDWIPRHEGKTIFLRGDHSSSMVSLRPPEYLTYEAFGPWGAPGPFYNWGHFYPDRYGS